MTKPESLLHYLLRKFPDLNESNYLNSNELDLHCNTFKKFLESITVVDSLSPVIDQHNSHNVNGQLNSLSYSEYIDSILSILYSKGLKKINQAHLAGTNDLTNKIGFQAQRLKGEDWAKLCNLMGRERFANFIFSVLCYCKRLGIELRIFDHEYTAYTARQHTINKSGMYYHWKSRDVFFSVLRGSPKQLVSKILGDSKGNSFGIPKNSRGLLKILTRAKDIDSTLQYHQLFLQIVPSKSSQNVFENASSFENVFRFVLTCLSKLFPDSTFGDHQNKNKLVACVRKYLRSYRNESFNVWNAITELNIRSIRWIGKSRAVTSTQDYLMRQNILRYFLKWLFEDFINNLVRNFWYVTEVTPSGLSEFGTAFFPHGCWRDLTGIWIDRYKSNYLQDVELDFNANAEMFNHGKLRLIPKYNDFRPLYVPSDYYSNKKQNLSYYEAYKNYDRNVVRPIREILRMQQAKAAKDTCPRNYSIQDVCKHLAHFKHSLKTKMLEIPIMYGMKFDMKHCYDNLNQSKIIEIIEGLFAQDDEQEEYFINRISARKHHCSLHANHYLLILDRSRVGELDILDYPVGKRGQKSILSEGGKNWKFSRAQILDLVKQQILNSTIELPSENHKVFKRKRGIFQGSPLLATFCDIVYNQLADDMYNRLNDPDKSILVRMADDFLFLSTAENDRKTLFEFATSTLALDYGAYINSQKCSWFDSLEENVIQFVGLEIDTKDLSFRRLTSVPYRVPMRMQTSFELILSYLRWNCGVRLSDFLLDLNITTHDGVLNNIRDVLEQTIDCLKEHIPPEIKISMEIFRKTLNFFLELVTKLSRRIAQINGDEFTCSCFLMMFKATIQLKLPGVDFADRLTNNILHD